MVKKKARNLPEPESQGAEPACKHLRKGLDDGEVRRALVNVDWTLCQDCQAETKEKTNNEEEEPKEEGIIWLCLKCGHRGCGRYSERQHALNHYNTPRSEPHCLVLSVGEWNVWCYLCDEQVHYSSSGRLQQLITHIQKKTKVKVPKTVVQSNQDDNRNDNKQEAEQEDVKKITNVDKEDKAASAPNDSKEVTVKGLSNLGNTCFFNAVMQNLSQTPTLRELLSEVKHLERAITVQVPSNSQAFPREVKLEQPPGPLTLAMWQFVTEMQETKKGVVTPKELFTQVCKKAVRFRGYQQQDSQELLRYLLDGMRGEEIQRVSAAMSKSLQETSEKIDDEEEVKKVVKECEKRRAIPNFVDRLFGGELTSTIMCETCHTVSLVHEPFLDLSLPVLDDLPAKKNTPKSAKAVYEKKDEDANDDSYVKEKNEVTSGPSKHLQKKAKKQAKKQAKTQRRQQKIQGKTLVLTDLNASQQDDEESIPDNNMLDNNCEPQEQTTAEALSPELTSDNDVEKNEEDLDCSKHNKDLCLANLENKAEASLENNHNSAVEDQENNHELNERVTELTGSNNESIDNKTQLSSETTEVLLENGNLPEVNMDIVEVQDEMSSSSQAEDDDVDNQLTENLNRLNLNSNLELNDIEIEIVNDVPTNQVYEVVNEDPKTAFCALSDRKELQLDEWSVLSCLYQFTRKENLVGNNQLLCNTCTQRQAKMQKHNNKVEKKFVYTNGKKQMLVSAPPPILTLHLKRFQQNGFSLHKINKHIKFPEVIDLAPFCTAKCKNICDGESSLLYSLYGVIEHSGTMRSGHYTAYVKSRVPNPGLCDLVLRGELPEAPSSEPMKGHWFYISDSHVQAVPVTKVLNAQAYLLFYERILVGLLRGTYCVSGDPIRIKSSRFDYVIPQIVRRTLQFKAPQEVPILRDNTPWDKWSLQETSEKIDDEEEVKKVVKECEKRRAIPNFVDRLFGGELTSTIMCETCHAVSLVHEPFLDLSLPVLDDSPSKKNTPKSAKAVYEKKDEDANDDSYVKEKNEVTSGPSKHLQKKAKKQAKKQAKTQRRQQKIQGKTLVLTDLNASQQDDEESIPDNNMLDNNCEPQEQTTAEALSPELTSDNDVEKNEEDLDCSKHNKDLCLANLENKAEASLENNHNSAVEDQENNHELNERVTELTGSNNESIDNKTQLSSETTEVLLENGNLPEVNMDIVEVQDEMSSSSQAEDDVDNQLTENLNRLNLNSNLELNDIEIEIVNDVPTNQVYEVVNEDPKTAFCALSDRKELQLDEWSVLSCLYQFTRKENLVGNNQLLCNTCTQRQAKMQKHNNKVEKKFVYTNGKKQMLVSAPPLILTLHLKRFQQNGFSLHKINKHIKFPEVIDLAPFCTAKCKNICDGESSLLYSLYGVIEHSGTMRSGHYTAYVKSRVPNPRLCDLVLRGALPEAPSSEPMKGHWFYISDSHVQAVPVTKVLNAQAYLLFYERIL
ncbi:ubiquitin carboxyl-terminal hydrolase 16-like [Hyperolius riggenbachi]|uniref:ubiquitin carboxyl-terminal hydrolase 16-like n=1 Tax=Hyperolius riggenbachi TaxID=752182 RepID=UPI0035A39943